MKHTLSLIVGVLLLACLLPAQTAVSYPVVGPQWYTPTAFVPATSTSVTTATSLVNFLYLANTSGSSVTVTVTDASTACSGGACSFWPTISIAANTVYTASMSGLVAVGGVKWSASTGSAVVGYMTGNYTGSTIADALPRSQPWPWSWPGSRDLPWDLPSLRLPPAPPVPSTTSAMLVFPPSGKAGF